MRTGIVFGKWKRTKALDDRVEYPTSKRAARRAE